MSENNICSVGVFTEKLGGKWKLSIIYHLKDRKLRFGQLAARIVGVSRKVLTHHLKQLEALENQEPCVSAGSDFYNSIIL